MNSQAQVRSQVITGFVVGAILLLLLLFAAAAGAAFGLGREVGLKQGEQQLQSARALNVVMGATTARSDASETLGTLLGRACKGLSAVAGSLHLAKEPGAEMRLVDAIGVGDYAGLSTVSPDDALFKAVLSSENNLLVLALDDRRLPWGALAPPRRAGSPFDGRRRVLAATVIGRVRAGWHGLLTLAWPDVDQALQAVDSVLALGRYASALLREFEATDRRAWDFQLLAESLRRQEALARGAAHDIGNRLGPVRSGLEFIFMDYGHSRHEEVQAILERLSEVSANADVIAALKEDLYQTERLIEQDELQIAALLELVPSLVKRGVEEMGASFGIIVEGEVPPVFGDRIALTRVLDNLLANAINYGQGGGSICLRVRRRGDEVEFAVEDSNRPIPEEELPHLFEYGYRLDPEAKVRGRGVGLWSCKEIVAAHGGRIWVEAGEQGNRFVFTAPTMTAILEETEEHAPIFA